MRHRRPRRLQIPPGTMDRTGAPFAAVLALGGPRRRWTGAIVATLALHLTVVAAAVRVPVQAPPPPPVHHITQAVTLEKPPPKPPPPPPTPPPPQRATPRAAPAPPPPAAAAKVIAAADDGLADASFDMVVGNATAYAGGASSASGTRTGPETEAPAPVARDLSRAASPGRKDWACAWPDEEQTSDLRDARVAISVQVERDGTPKQVDIVSAPPGGFADAARTCALGEVFRAALDSEGRPVASATKPFVVHFVR